MAGTRRAKVRRERFERKRIQQKYANAPNKKAFCVGCGQNYGQVHLMLKHRREEACGGLHLSNEERLSRGLPLL